MQKKNLKYWQERCPQKDQRRKSPTATLLSWTPFPFNMIYQLYSFNKHGRPLEEFRSAEKYEFNFVFQLLKEDWCGLLELPTFVWQFNLPRSLHAQLRSHRHWSFFSESHQLMLPTNFADDGDYFHIPECTVTAQVIESNAMVHAQEAYKNLLKEKVLPGLARGVLPMHVNLNLSAACNLRSLFQTIVLRRCDILQGEYWNPLLTKMEIELCEKVDNRYAKLFGLKPCDINNKCLSDIEQNLRVNKKDPHDPCPIFLERYYHGKERKKTTES